MPWPLPLALQLMVQLSIVSASVVDAARSAVVAVGDGQVRNGDRFTGADVKHGESVVAVHGQLVMRRAADGDTFVHHQFKAGQRDRRRCCDREVDRGRRRWRRRSAWRK